MRRPRALLVTLISLGVAALAGSARRVVAESARPAVAAHAVPRTPALELAPPRPALEPAAPVPIDPRFASLRALSVLNINSGQAAEIKLYDSSGHLDESAADKLDALLCDARDPEHHETAPIDRRLLQLMYRSAYHFRAREVVVISAYRKPGRHREGLHAIGRAIDFRLRKVPAAALAAYLRTLPRVGVGVYTHPRTQFVHLDVREQSYHWLDGSPPGRSWREQSIGDRSIPRRDLRYRPADDWPEGTEPPND